MSYTQKEKAPKVVAHLDASQETPDTNNQDQLTPNITDSQLEKIIRIAEVGKEIKGWHDDQKMGIINIGLDGRGRPYVLMRPEEFKTIFAGYERTRTKNCAFDYRLTARILGVEFRTLER